MTQPFAHAPRPPPDPAQLAALHALRRIYGRDWKARLLAEWITAPDGLGHPPELCALRRSHGPSWLLDYTLPDR